MLLLWLNLSLLTAAVVGLIYRGRGRASRILLAYLGFGILSRIPVLLWRDQFYVWWYWLLTEVMAAILVFALAVELLLLVFGRLPVGRRRAAWTAAVLLVSVLVALILAPAPPTGASEDWVYYQGNVRVSQAKVAAGVLFAFLLIFALQYRIPLDPLHRDVAAGLALWELLQVCAERLAILDPLLGIGPQSLPRLIYTGMLVAWVHAAWRADEVSILSPVALRLLRPWQVRA